MFIAAVSFSSRPSRSQLKVSATVYKGAVTASPEHKFAVVVARFNSLVTKQLLEGAHETFAQHGVAAENVDVRFFTSLRVVRLIGLR